MLIHILQGTLNIFLCTVHHRYKANGGDANLSITLSQEITLGGEKITAGVLCNPLAFQQLVRNEQAYKFLKNVRGSPAHW